LGGRPQLESEALGRNEWAAEFVFGLWLMRGGEAVMIARPKHGSAREKVDRDEWQRRLALEEALDEALENTFPASDPVAMEQPAPAS